MEYFRGSCQSCNVNVPPSRLPPRADKPRQISLLLNLHSSPAPAFFQFLRVLQARRLGSTRVACFLRSVYIKVRRRLALQVAEFYFIFIFFSRSAVHSSSYRDELTPRGLRGRACGFIFKLLPAVARACPVLLLNALRTAMGK